MTTIHAEITAGRETIVLLAGGLGEPEEVAYAAKLLKALTPLFSKSNPPGALVVPATWAAVVQLEATFGARLVKGPNLQGWIGEQAQRRTVAELPTYVPPAGFKPYPWQSAGASLIARLGRALITDEPGTGKTITTILGLVEWAAGLGSKALDVLPVMPGPVVVVCPASVVDPWVDAWREWAPHVPVVAWRGTPAKRKALAGTADVYVMSYETARTDCSEVQPRPVYDLNPVAVVIDECHLVKNPKAARSRAVRRLAKRATDQGGAVVALSGTPITHHPGDLWATLVALEPHAWPARERWVHRYCQTVPTDGYREEVLGLEPATEPEFRLTLLGQHRRVAKADVLNQLPPKVYSTRTVDLPTKWRKVYDDFEAQMLAELPDGTELQAMDVMSKFTHLSRLASAAADVEITHGPDVDDVTREPKRHVSLNLKAPSWKVDALLEVLDERPGEPVVAFAPSRQLVVLAGEAATKAGLRVGYVIGDQTAAERTRNVAAFQAGELDLICVTTSAGGVGITLTAARTVVFLQRPWSLVEALQAEDRCHRIGSERHDSIEVIDIVARDTLDTRVRAVLRERAGQLSDLVQDPRIVADLLGGARTERKSA